MKVSQSVMNKLVIAAIASMGLTACAGGGSGSSMSAQPSVSESPKDNAGTGSDSGQPSVSEPPKDNAGTGSNSGQPSVSEPPKDNAGTGSNSGQPSVSEQLKDNANVDTKDEKVIEYLEKSSLKDVPKELQAKVLEVKGDEYTGARKQYAGKLGKGESVKAMQFLDGEEPFSKEQLQKMDVYVNGKKYEGSKGGELDVLPKGLSEQKIELYGADKEQNYALLKTWVYEQPYSVVRGYFGYALKDGNLIRENGQNPEEIPFNFALSDIRGVATDEDKLPKAGSFQYEGRAFGGNRVLSKESLDNHNGVFRYTIDFDHRKGSGSIEGMEQYGKIELKEAAIEKIAYLRGNSSLGLKDQVSYFGVNEGVATSEKDNEIKKYHLGIFGEAANEVAGAVSQEHKYEAVIGFGGEKK